MSHSLGGPYTISDYRNLLQAIKSLRQGSVARKSVGRAQPALDDSDRQRDHGQDVDQP